MSYNKIGFLSGQTLKASDLNHMEDGIAKANSILETQGGDTLTWDGNTEGLTSAIGIYFKVSSATPAAADIASGRITAVAEGENVSLEFDSSALNETEAGTLAVLDGIVMIVPEGSVGIDVGLGIIFPEAGTYFISNEEVQITSITIPGYTGFTTEKIASKYLPEDIGGGNGLPEVTTADAGKFMRVSSDGKWAAEMIPNAEEATF